MLFVKLSATILWKKHWKNTCFFHTIVEKGRKKSMLFVKLSWIWWKPVSSSPGSFQVLSLSALLSSKNIHLQRYVHYHPCTMFCLSCVFSIIVSNLKYQVFRYAFIICHSYLHKVYILFFFFFVHVIFYWWSILKVYFYACYFLLWNILKKYT